MSCSTVRARSGSAMNESSVTSMTRHSGGTSALTQQFVQVRQEDAAQQLRRREVDRDRRVRMPIARQRCRSAIASRADLLRQHLHQAGAAGRRQEQRRRQQALLRVLPADQRLEAADLLGRGVDLRLVPEHQLAVRDALCAAPRPAAASAGRSRRCGRRRAARRRGSAWPGTSRRRRGAAARSWPGRSVARTVTPIEASAASSMPSMIERVADRRAAPTGPVPSARASRRSASTSANSSPPRRATMTSGGSTLAHPVGHQLQHRVAGRMPEGVVDVLEAVQVEDHQRERGARRAISSSSLASTARRLGSRVRSSLRDSANASAASFASRSATTSRPPAASRVITAGTTMYGRSAPVGQQRQHQDRDAAGDDHQRRALLARDEAGDRHRAPGRRADQQCEREAVEGRLTHRELVGARRQIGDQLGVGERQRDEAQQQLTRGCASRRGREAPSGRRSGPRG